MNRIDMRNNRCPRRRSRVGNAIWRRFSAASLLATLLMGLVILGCAGPTLTRTSTPIPTATPTPTPTPASAPVPTPTISSGPTDAVAVLSDAQASVAELFAMVPADYESAVFADVRVLLADPVLREAFEEQGTLAAFGPAAETIEQQVDAVVVAQGDRGVLRILRGPLDIEAIVARLTTSAADVESENYGGYEIRRLDVETAFFTISPLDDITAFFVISFSPDNPSADVVKGALDTVGGQSPGYLSDPLARQLFEGVPRGFAMLIARDCSLFVGEFEGCKGYAVSATIEEERGVINGVLGFTTPALAELALSGIRAAVEEDSKDVPEILEATKVTLEGDVVRLRTIASVNEALSAVLGLGDS